MRLFTTRQFLATTLLLFLSSSTFGAVRHRPIEDFLSRQGVVVPNGGYVEWSDAAFPRTGKGVFASIDYAAVDEAILNENGQTVGTEITGTIREKTLSDGRAEVVIKLHFRNALAAALFVDVTVDPFQIGPFLFGANVFDVMAGETPSVVDGHLEIVLINDAPNAPLPDLMSFGGWEGLRPGQEQLSLHLRAYGEGLTPDGDRASLRVHQHGVDLNTPNARFLQETVVVKVFEN